MLPHTARAWLHAVQVSDWFTARRGDAAQRLSLLLHALAAHANWDDHTSFPTWARLMDRTGWSRSTLAAWLAQLQHEGFLMRLEGGSTPRFRPMALAALHGNRAAVYQLRLPLPHRAAPTAGSVPIRTPTTPPNLLPSSDIEVPTRASGFVHSRQQNPRSPHPIDGPDGPGLDQNRPVHDDFFDRHQPVGEVQMLAAATALRAHDRALWRLTPRWIRALMRPWWRAGWTNNDIRYALNHRPAVGGPVPSDRCPAEQLRHPDGWVRHRMQRWLRADTATPLPAPRAWSRTRAQVAGYRGAAAAARLPYGATDLRPEHLAVTDTDRRATAEELVRRWARELHDARNAPTPDDRIATLEHRAAVRAGFNPTTRARREPGPASSAEAPPDSGADHSHARRTCPPPDTHPTIYERALARARAEGGAARFRSRRRQF